MERTLTFTCAELPAAEDWARRQLGTWGIAAPHTVRWLRRGAELLGPERVGRLVLSYDPDDRLVSVDVWHDEKLLYGMDDLV